MESPEIQQQISAAVDEAEAAEARRQDPEEIEARQQSRSAYEAISDQDAQSLAGDVFSALIDQPTWQGLEPPAGEQVVRYLDDNSALIAPTGDQASEAGQVVYSPAPLRARTETGAVRPVDADLISQGDHLESANASADAELPSDLDQGIDLASSNINLEPVDSPNADDAAVLGPDKVFWAGGGGLDTDFMATPTQTGVETFWQLRSERSPEELSLDLDLPAGSTLDLAFHGLGAEITDQAGAVAEVRPPQAFDADGTNVPVQLTTAGDDVRLSIAHRAGDWKYPILVDPTIDETWGPGNGCPSGVYSTLRWGWEKRESTSNFIAPGCNAAEGVVNFAPGGHFYYLNNYAQWFWKPPSSTYLSQVDFSQTKLAFTGTDSVCSNTGIWSSANQNWQAKNTYCTAYSGRAQSFVLGTAGQDNNVAISQLYFPSSKTRTQSSWTDAPGAKFYVGDRHAPVLTSAGQVGSTAWTDDSISGGGSSTYQYSASATDAGLGVDRLRLRYPSGTLDNKGRPQDTTVTKSRGCSGVTACLSPSTGWSSPQAFIYQLPEGNNQITATALDQVGNAGTRTWQQPVDRSAPVVQAPSGSLYANRSNIRGDQSYELNVSATDGSTQNTNTMRSGVQRIDIYVDGEDDPRKTFTQTCPDPEGSCPLPRANQPLAIWKINPGEFELGDHVVEIIATDTVGHESASWQLNLTAVTADDDEPAVNVQETASGIDVSADDLGPVMSGVTHLEVWADGTRLYQNDRECPVASCGPMTASVPLSGVTSPAVADIDVYADDQAGNGGYRHVGQHTQRFVNFGLNDLWGDFGEYESGAFVDTKPRAYLRLAADMGADTVRFPVSMCRIQDPALVPGAQPPISGAQYFQDRLDVINKVNTDGVADNDVRLIIEVLGTPYLGGGCSAGPQGGSDAQWEAYVGDILTRWGPATKGDGGTPNDPSDDTNYNLKAIELWNEPNNPDFWGGGNLEDFVPQPHPFAHLVNLGSQVITDYNNAHSASVKAVPGGLLPLTRLPKRQHIPASSPAADAVQGTYLAKAFDTAAGSGETIAAGRIDAISVHLYANVAKKMTGENGVRAKIYDDEYGGLDQTLAGTGFGAKDRWITEAGFPTERTHKDPNDLSSPIVTRGNEKKQASRIREIYKHFAAINQVTSFVVHRLVNNAGNEKGGFGIVFDNCQTRPAFGVLANLVTGSDPPSHADPSCSGIAGEGP